MKKLKSKLQRYSSFISYYINKGRFKEIYFITVLLSIYSALLGRGDKDTIDGILNVLSFPTFLLIFFVLLLVNTISFNKLLDKVSYFQEIRMKNKYNIIVFRIKETILVTLFYLFLTFILIYSFIYLGHLGYITNTQYGNYNISKLFFLIYFTIRLTIISCAICTFNTILYGKLKYKVFIFDFIFLAGLYLDIFNTNMGVSLNIYYILGLMSFKSFKYDLISSIICILLLILINYISMKIITRRKK